MSNKISLNLALALIVLLPIFFVPSRVLPLVNAKLILLALGVIVSVLVFLFEFVRHGKVNVPWNPLFVTVLLFPIVYYASSVRANPEALSLFGYSFEAGTFGYMLLVAVLFGVISILFTDVIRITWALGATALSFSIIALFSLLRIISGGDFLGFGVFFENTANPLGRWTDLATLSALLAVLSGVALKMLPTEKWVRNMLIGLFSISIFLLSILGFLSAFVVTLGVSLLILAYYWFYEDSAVKTAPENVVQVKVFSTFIKDKNIWPFLVLTIISVLFLVNPTLPTPGKTLNSVLSGSFGVENFDVRPSLSTTLAISKSALSQAIVLGSGPNTFYKDWLSFKPKDVNLTPFWALTFSYGIGFIPTQVSSIGVLGSLLWLVFFLFFILLGILAYKKITAKKKIERFVLVSTYFSALILWVSSFFYTPSFTLLAFAFIFTALFIAACQATSIVSSKELEITKNIWTKIASVALMLVLVVSLFSIGFTAINKTASAYYFQKATTVSVDTSENLATIESLLNKAISISPEDTYYAALAETHFVRARLAVNDTEKSTQENIEIFNNSVASSIQAAIKATEINPASYTNWVFLGSIYAALVPKPLAIEGSYESAKAAFGEAQKLNPNSPDIPLLLARLEFDRGEVDETRRLIQESLSLKQDYVDAYIFLAQFEMQQNNLEAAIGPAETAAILKGNDASLFYEVGILNYTSEDYEDAARFFYTAISLVPDFANAKFYFGLTLEKLGEIDLALQQFEEVLSANPENQDLKAIVEDLKSRRDI